MAPGNSSGRLIGPLWSLSRWESWLAIPLVALTYASVAALSLAVAIPPGYASALWPAAGIAVAACVAGGIRLWPGVLLGAALANLGVAGTPPLVALAIGAGNAAEAVVAAWLLQRAIGTALRIERAADVWTFAAVAFAAPLVAATGGVATLVLAGAVPLPQFGAHWITWWLGDATGIVIVAPLLLAWSAPASPGDRARPAERRFFVVLLALCAAFILAGERLPAEALQTLAYLMLPLVTWAAARLDRKWVTAASFAISAVAVLDMLDGTAAPFPWVSLNQSLLLLQLFVSAVALTGLTLSAYAGEIERARRALDDSRGELDRALARLAERAAGAEPAPVAVPLNARERAVLALIAEGHTSAEVGRLLHLSPRTIESYRTRIMEKLDVPNFAQLIQYAVRHGILHRKS